MVINLAIISLVVISVLLWTTFFKEYSNLNKTEKTAQKEEQVNEQVEEEAVPVQKTEQKSKEIWVKEEHGIFLVYTYNSTGEEVRITYNDELGTILEQLGEPDQKNRI